MKCRKNVADTTEQVYVGTKRVGAENKAYYVNVGQRPLSVCGACLRRAKIIPLSAVVAGLSVVWVILLSLLATSTAQDWRDSAARAGEFPLERVAYVLAGWLIERPSIILFIMPLFMLGLGLLVYFRTNPAWEIGVELFAKGDAVVMTPDFAKPYLVNPPTSQQHRRFRRERLAFMFIAAIVVSGGAYFISTALTGQSQPSALLAGIFVLSLYAAGTVFLGVSFYDVYAEGQIPPEAQRQFSIRFFLFEFVYFLVILVGVAVIATVFYLLGLTPGSRSAG